MLELPHADAGSIAIAGDRHALKGRIAKECTRRDGRHTPMQAVKAKGTVQKISWALARTTNTTEFDDILRHNIQFIHRADDLVRNRIVSTALAEGAGVAAVIILGKARQVYIGWCASHRKRLSHGGITPFA